jgi:hypothetical protein
VRAALAIDGDEGQRHPEAGSEVPLGQALDERRWEPRTERAGHGGEGSIVAQATLGPRGGARAARAVSSPLPTPRNLMMPCRGPPLAFVARYGSRRTGLDGVGDGLMERLQWWLLLLSAVMFSMSGCATLEDWHVWSAHPAHFASAEHLAFSAKSHKTVASITEADAAAAAREDWWGRLVPQEKKTVVAAVPPATGGAAVAEREGAEGVDREGVEREGVEREGAERDGSLHRVMPAKKATIVAASARTPAPDRAPADVMDMTGQWRGHWTANGVWGEKRESEAEMVFSQSGTRGTSHMRLADTVAAVGVPEVVRYFGSMGTPMNYRVSRSEVVARYENGPAVLLRFTRVGDRIYGRIDASPSFLLVLDRQ